MDRTEKATLGGGCFWCLEPVFAGLRGVVHVEPGYAGGHRANPSYEQVCSGATGHAEVVQVTFHPDEMAYQDLLQVFFAVHDPTTLNRQGADAGTQYRSVIFFHSPEQEQVAEEVVHSLEPEESWEGPHVVTEVLPFEAFYPAEAYHKDYFNKNPGQGYCRIVIAPKLQKFKKRFSEQISPSH